jgi:hypothetical protein
VVSGGNARAECPGRDAAAGRLGVDFFASAFFAPGFFDERADESGARLDRDIPLPDDRDAAQSDADAAAVKRLCIT